MFFYAIIKGYRCSLIVLLLLFFRDSVRIRNPRKLTQEELELMAQRIFDESDEEVVGGSDDEEGEEIILHSDHNSESEQEADNNSHDFETVSVVTNEPIMKGRDKETVWRKHPTVKKFSKTPQKNLVKIFPIATVDKELVTDEMSSFLLFLPLK